MKCSIKRRYIGDIKKVYMVAISSIFGRFHRFKPSLLPKLIWVWKKLIIHSYCVPFKEYFDDKNMKIVRSVFFIMTTKQKIAPKHQFFARFVTHMPSSREIGYGLSFWGVLRSVPRNIFNITPENKGNSSVRFL